jgi:hypothetical protein
MSGRRTFAIAAAAAAAVVVAACGSCGSRGSVAVRGQAEPGIALAGYGVVAGDPTRATANRLAIQRAIDGHAGGHVDLVLPPGEIFLDRGPRYTSLRFSGTRTTDLVLRGDPDSPSSLVLQGDATGGLWLGIEIVDGARRITLRDFRIYQGEIANPSPTQQDHLIQINAQRALTGDVEIDNVHFGPCIGDALRIAGSAPYYVERVRAHDFTMKVDGQPQAPAGGARSGVSLQRGFRDIEISNFYIGGVKNSPIDMEPTTAAVMDQLRIHDGVVDNTLGLTAHAISIGGYEDGARRVTPLTNSSLRNVAVLEGQVNIINTESLALERVTISATGRGPMAGVGDPLLYVYHHNQGLTLTDVDIVRDAGAAPGPLALVLHGVDTYTTGMRITGGAWISRVDPGGRTPFLAAFESVQRLGITGLRLEVAGAAPGRYGIKLRPSARDIAGVELRDVQIESGGGGAELAGGVWAAATNQHAIDELALVNVAVRGARYGVLFDGTPGGRIQPTPLLEGIACPRCERPWASVNAAAHQVFPLLGRDVRTRAARFGGTLPPEGTFSAPAGSEYVYEDGGRQLQFRKAAGDGPSGWHATEEIVSSGPCDPTIERTQITTDGEQSYSLPDGTADGQVKRFAITAATGQPRGVLRPSRLATGRVLRWTTPGSVALTWSSAQQAWRVTGKLDRIAVE